jgi:Dolichyl-phosphate-mannose-protein mannosyltransferase
MRVIQCVLANQRNDESTLPMNILDQESPETDKPWQRVETVATGWICLSLVLIWIIHRVWAALFIPWWFNTDEVVIYYEVVRQLRLDPSQTFFDIPGTPFMSLTSVLTSLWWVGDRLFSITRTANPSDFVFANVQGVFTLMRMLTLGMYLAAVTLAYDLVRRCAGALIGVVAALLFASLPIFVDYSYFVRTESLGLVLSLAAIWMVLYSPWTGTPAIYGCAGVLAGAAMAARFHFAFVGFPVILIIFFLQDRKNLPAPEGSQYSALYEVSGTLGALLAAGGLVTLGFKTKLIAANELTNTMMLTSPAGPAQYPDAKALIAGLWLLLGLGALLILLTHRFSPGRRWIWPTVNPFTLLATLGFIAGFVLANPEFLWRGEFQLRSIQFYSDWTDAGLLSLGPIASWWKITTYYFATAFPERWAQALFLVGFAMILWQRRPVHLALAGGAALCFCAHPLHMKLWPHHIIPWLPLLCFVAAVPVGVAGSWLLQQYRHTRFVAVAMVVFASAAVVWACAATRLQHENDYLAFSRSRTDQIVEMNGWLSKNVPRDTYLLVSYYALNEDGFREWIENAGVQVPDFVKKNNDVHIWWMDRSLVDGHAGFLCMSHADIAFFRDDLERKHPGSTYNPFENRNFQPVARFGADLFGLTVFQFDCRSKVCSS